MNFQLAKIGHSFKGSMAYYLFDKPQDGEPQPTTSERVAWTATRNLATDGPHTATRIMIATAESADALKAAAGVKATGRKSTAGPVFSFSLQWRADELPGRDREEMTRAADHVLKVLKLDHLQAVIVCHQDTAHPHVHVIVNRIDPETGKSAAIRAPDVKALDRWANQYEQQRGQVVSERRAKKYEAEARIRKEHPDAEKRRQYARNRDAERKAQRQAARDQARSADPRTVKAAIDTTPAGMLKELGDAQKARHRQEWAQLATGHKRRRSAVYEAAGRHMTAELARAKEAGRPLWSKLHGEQRTERRRFEDRERRLAGIVRNAIAAAKMQQRAGTEGNPKGFLSMAFAYVGSRDARRQAFAADQEQQRRRFAAELKAKTDTRLEAIKAARVETLEKSAAMFAGERTALMERHGRERAGVREAWRQLNLQRGRRPAPAGEKPAMKDFDKAAGQYPNAVRQRVQLTPQAIATPAPAPAPAGMPQPPARTMQNVPRVDQAAAWAKTEAGRAEMKKHEATPRPTAPFERAAETVYKVKLGPEMTAQLEALQSNDKPAPAEPKAAPPSAERRSSYWNELAQSKAAEMPRDQSRGRAQDQDQEPKM